jgi:hypothetical protein
MKLLRVVLLGILAILLPLSGYSRIRHATKLQGPYSVGGKHAKHNTYDYLGKKKHHKATMHRSPVSGQMIPGDPVR